jgi:hypothetical protein
MRILVVLFAVALAPLVASAQPAPTAGSAAPAPVAAPPADPPPAAAPPGDPAPAADMPPPPTPAPVMTPPPAPAVAPLCRLAEQPEQPAAGSATKKVSFHSPMRQVCEDELSKDDDWWFNLQARLRRNIHEQAFREVQTNNRHVVAAYGAMWLIAIGFVVLMWMRQQALEGRDRAPRGRAGAPRGRGSGARPQGRGGQARGRHAERRR